MQAIIVLARFAFVELRNRTLKSIFSRPLVLPSKMHRTPPYNTSDDTRGGQKGREGWGEKGDIREKKVRRETGAVAKAEKHETDESRLDTGDLGGCTNGGKGGTA